MMLYFIILDIHNNNLSHCNLDIFMHVCVVLYVLKDKKVCPPTVCRHITILICALKPFNVLTKKKPMEFGK